MTLIPSKAPPQSMLAPCCRFVAFSNFIYYPRAAATS
jgi:hypothetical protein